MGYSTIYINKHQESAFAAGLDFSSFLWGFAAFSSVFAPPAEEDSGVDVVKDPLMMDQARIAQDFRSSFLTVLSETDRHNPQKRSFDLLSARLAE